MGCPGTEKVDPRVTRTRKLLLDALKSLMKEKGYEAITVQDITERATVNRATFYAHFTDKQELLDQYVRSRYQEFVMARFDCLPDMNITSLKAMIAVIAEFTDAVVRSKHLPCASLARFVEKALQEEVNEMFRHWLQKSPDHPFRGHRPELVALTLSSSVLAASLDRAKNAKRITAEVLAAELVELLVPAEQPATLAR